MAIPNHPQEPTETTSPTPEKVNIFDPCNTNGSTDETAACRTLGKIESGGKYTALNASGASGRYQFTKNTGMWVMRKAGISSNTTTLNTLWNECSRSASAKCKNVQDKMCHWYSNHFKKRLKKDGVDLTVSNMYLRWNQGLGGSRIINSAAAAGTVVTDARTKKNMRGQAWNTQNTTYDAREFKIRMDKWIKSEKGVDPNSLI